MKKCIVIASFGTVEKETRRKCIDEMVKRVREIFPNLEVFSALTSRFIIKKIKEKGEEVFSLEETIEKRLKEGYERIIIQPSFMTEGIEYKRIIDKYGENDKIKIGKPILHDKEDYEKMAQILEKESKNGINLFMGHGTEGFDGEAYREVQKRVREKIIIATVEGEPSFEKAIEKISKMKEKRVFLQPMMIVAGEHAKNDMIGEKSWKSRLEEMGYETEYRIKGLGEIKETAEIIAEHIRESEKWN